MSGEPGPDQVEAADGAAPAAKRVKREHGQDAAEVKAEQEAVNDPDPKQEDDDDERIPLPLSTTRSAVKKGHECPYLDTILRQVGGK